VVWSFLGMYLKLLELNLFKNFFFLEQGFEGSCCVAQAGLELWSSYLSFLDARIRGYPVQVFLLFVFEKLLCYVIYAIESDSQHEM
jgi:hypothetical protein